jgi:hypothetical protein
MATPVRQRWWKGVACRCLNIFKQNTGHAGGRKWWANILSAIVWSLDKALKFFPAHGSWKISYLRCFFCLVLELNEAPLMDSNMYHMLWLCSTCNTRVMGKHGMNVCRVLGALSDWWTWAGWYFFRVTDWYKLRAQMMVPATFVLICFCFKPPVGDCHNSCTLNSKLLKLLIKLIHMSWGRDEDLSRTDVS